MASVINQPTKNPTNKTVAGAGSLAIWSAIMGIAGLTLKNMAPGWYDPEVLLQISLAGPVFVQFTASWFTKDAPNQIVIVEDGK